MGSPLFEVGNKVLLAWDSSEEPIVYTVIKIERGFLILETQDGKERFPVRPASPWKIEIIKDAHT